MGSELKIFQLKLKQALQQNRIPLKQKQVADFLGVSIGTAWHYLNGTRIPRYSKLDEMAKRLGVSTQFLLTNNRFSDKLHQQSALSFAQDSAIINQHLITLPMIDVTQFIKNPETYMTYHNQTMVLNENIIQQMLGLQQRADHLVVCWNHPQGQPFFKRFDWVLGTSVFTDKPAVYLVEDAKHNIRYQQLDQTDFTKQFVKKDTLLFKMLYQMRGELL